MLEEPNIPHNHIFDTLLTEYGFLPVRFAFLPLGADQHTAVYKAATFTDTFLVKLRTANFNKTTVLIPKLLHDSGIEQVIPPIFGKGYSLWARTDLYTMTVYPFIEGENGFDRPLSAQHWIELGQTLKRIHTAAISQADLDLLPRETFSPFYRDEVRRYQAQFAAETFTDPVSIDFARLINSKRADIDALVRHTHTFAADVQKRDLPFVLCHADIHVWNLLITPSNTLYVVDWDTLILAPKERDLMFIGSGIGDTGAFSVPEQLTRFYQGYGTRDDDLTAIAYYRCERIVQDIYEYCRQNLSVPVDSQDRLEGLRQLESQFQPGAVVERALQSAARVS